MEIIIPIKEYVIREAIKKTLSTISIEYVKDEAEFKRISAFTKEAGNVILWQGADYDLIGQWTDTDVINRIKTIFA
jgi:cyanophycinase-like exopeptidase